MEMNSKKEIERVCKNCKWAELEDFGPVTYLCTNSESHCHDETTKSWHGCGAWEQAADLITW